MGITKAFLSSLPSFRDPGQPFVSLQFSPVTGAAPAPVNHHARSYKYPSDKLFSTPPRSVFRPQTPRSALILPSPLRASPPARFSVPCPFLRGPDPPFPTTRNGTSCPRAREALQAKPSKDLGLATWNITTDQRIETLVGEIKEIFRSMGDGEISPSAYDTAWVARIPSIDDTSKPHFPETLDWILRNQLEDGSWGEPSFFLLYDRLICTLACILALRTWSRGEDQIAKGLQFLWTHTKNLEKEPTTLRTCGFEVAFLSMLNEARGFGLDLPYNLPNLREISKLREKKIKRIPLEIMHSVHTSLLYSLEALQEVVQWDKILKLQSTNGSFLSSPSATAVAYMKTGDKKCLEFLTYIVKRFGDNAPCVYPVDLFERMWAVDTIQRLGIDHHFRKEISGTLDYVYRNTGKRGVCWERENLVPDVDNTSMALRLMRLHGYAISPDVLEYFKDDDGSIVCMFGETNRGVSDMFDLYRFSQIAFPGEEILKEAKVFSEEYLRTCLENNQLDDKWCLKKALHKEVYQALRYPWKMSLQRLDTREYINHYGENDVWIGKALYWMYNVNNPRYLELAKLDYNKLQAMYSKEIINILKWWSNCGLDDCFAKRVCPKEIHFSIAATLYEPELSVSRIAYSKCNCIENILKDLFENHESMDELRLFCQGVEQWNPSCVHSMSLLLKAAFMGMYDTLNELSILASNAQGKDMFPYLHGLRLKQIHAYLKNRNEREEKPLQSLKECIKIGKKDAGVAIRVLPAMFLMGEHTQDYYLQCLDDRSKFHDKLSLFLALLFNVMSYKRAPNKECSSAVHCTMKEENCTEIEALDHLNNMIENTFDELVHEYLKPSRVPRSFRRLMFEHAKVTRYFLTSETDPSKRSEMVNSAMERLFTPIRIRE